MDTVELLAKHATLAAAPRSELAWLAAHGTLRSMSEGQILSAKGVQVEGLFVILEGHIAIFVDRGAGPTKITEWRTGDVTGMLPYSRMVAAPGNSVAQVASEVFVLPCDQFPEMIRECHELTSILVHKMVDRARVFTSSDLHNEKMVSLGKLSAGLAHELNNPASAIERGASLLEDRLEEAEIATRALGASRLSDSQLAALDAVRASCLAKGVQGVLSPIEQAEREDAISDWLAGHGLRDDIAGTLAETAVTLDALDQIAAEVKGAPLDAVLRWAAAGCSVRGLASEILEAAMRISGLVTAIKGFTHMDQATVADAVDVAQSLSNTVAVLRSKARMKAASVTVRVEPNLPRVSGFVGELNQIWANLIDNALDAIPEGGKIEVSAGREHDHVVVRVIDNGTGIPPAVRERIFDPFFTTKKVGQGTGLGLDIVRRLVVHNGAQIEVESQPGRTAFIVSLSLTDDTRSGAPA